MGEYKFQKLLVWRKSIEVVAALEIAINLNLGNKDDLLQAINEVNQLSAMLTGLIKSLKSTNRLIAND